MSINKNFIDETNKIIKDKEILDKEIKKRYNEIILCLEEMREKYAIALTELKKEFHKYTTDDVLCGFSTTGYRQIESVIGYENYYEVVAEDYFRDWEPKQEIVKIPYKGKATESPVALAWGWMSLIWIVFFFKLF